MFFVGAIVGFAIFGAFFFLSQPEQIDYEERQNEIMAMDASDVIDTFIPELRARIEQLSEEGANNLVRAIISELGSTFEEIGKESYLRGYSDGSQGIRGNISASD